MASNLVILPTYNERETIAAIVEAVLAELPESHVLIVDDNSPDGTGDVADDLAKADERVRVLHRAGKLGLGTAYLAGFRLALEDDYETVFEMDADFSHNPRSLPALRAAVDSGADLALGSRYVDGGGTENWGFVRRVISWGGNVYARTILGIPIADLTGGFKCFRREVLEALDLDAVRSEGYAFQVEMTYRAIGRGFRVVEVPITFLERRAGQSKMSRKVMFEFAHVPWRLRFDRGA